MKVLRLKLLNCISEQFLDFDIVALAGKKADLMSHFEI